MDPIYKLIRLNRYVSSHRFKFASIFFAHELKLRHLFLRFDPLIACNLSCSMCYFSAGDFRKNNKGMFSSEEISRIAELFFPRALQIVIGCGTEPTLYKNFTDLVVLAKKYKIPFVGFTSNGQLISEEHIGRFVTGGLDELTLSVHGVRKETYENFMVGSSYERFHGVLSMLEAVKKRLKSKTPYLRLNYTVNAENLDELGDFFDIFGSYSIRTLQVRPVMDIGGQYRRMLTSEEIGRYNAVVAKLRGISKQRGMTFMANESDPTYQTDNYKSVILPALHRYISPQRVWMPDFQWKDESYDEYCKRIGWRNYLARSVFLSRREVTEQNERKYAARYDVTL